MAASPEAERNAGVIRRFHQNLCNRWQLGLVDDLVGDNIRFRASLGAWRALGKL